MSDELMEFAAEEPGSAARRSAASPWTVLVVDDEAGIHTVTKHALADLEVDGRPLRFLNAYSAAEARTLISAEPDIAMCLLDVVMETEHAGLELARWIRREHGDALMRIILRTGQPGQAPERRVITEYDINGYKEKAELTATRLYSTAYTMICSYRDLAALQRAREALARIIMLSRELSSMSTVQALAGAAIEQLGALLNIDRIVCTMAMGTHCEDLRVLAATPEVPQAGTVSEALPPELAEEFCAALRERPDSGISRTRSGAYLVTTDTSHQASILLRAEGQAPLNPRDQELMRLYCESMALAIENVQLRGG